LFGARKFNTDIEFENMDFLELTSSEEHLLFEAVCNVSSDVPIAQSEPTRTVVNTAKHVEPKRKSIFSNSISVLPLLCFTTGSEIYKNT
jgi:hypothetical protein